MRTFLLVPAFGLLAAAPLSAKPPSTAPGPDGTPVSIEPGLGGVSKDRASDVKDPRRVVCKESVDLGTRLPRGKVCTTRAQLAQRRQVDREVLERGQNRQAMVWVE